MADVFDKEPISFIDQNEQFPVLNEKVGLTYQQFKTLVENTNYLYNNLGLSSIDVGTVTTQFPSPGSFSDVILEHNISYIDGKPYDLLNFLFKLPTPRISASLTTTIVDYSKPTGMTLLTAPIKEIINGVEVTTGYEFEFHANIPQTPEYYLQYVEQNLSESEKAQARANIGAGTSSFSGNYEDLVNIPSFSDVAYSGLYEDLLNKPSSVLYTTQTLTDEEKQVARENIGAGTSNFDGNYSSLTNKPINVSEFYNDADYISSDELFFVSYAEVQNLTEIQKSRARNNIGAGTSSFDGNYSSLIGSPTNLSDFNNDTGFITLAEVPSTDLSNYYTKEETNELISSIEVDLSNYYTKAETDSLISSITVDLSDYYTKEQVDTLIANIEIDLTDYYTKTETDTAINTKFNSLSTVAKTGSYTDLIDTPNIPTKTSDITNDSGFITNAVDNLVNYYTKAEIGNMFADNVTFKFVTELPLTGIANVVYFVSNADGTSGNLFDEYVWTNTNTWELIGSASIDLSNYYTKSEVDSLLPNMTLYYTKTEVNSLLPDMTNYYTIIETNTAINNKFNTLSSVAKSGSYTDLINRPTIPTKVSDLTNDSGFITDSTSTLTNYYDKTTIDTMLSSLPVFDSSLYYTKTETDGLISDIHYVSYDAQTLNAIQQAQVRANIGAGTSDFNGSYNSLTDKPTFSTVATSGSYTDLLNKPVIDTAIMQTTNAVQNQAIYNRFVSVDNDISSATTTANNAYSTAQSASSTANSINTKLNSLTLVDNGDNTYTLKFTQDNVVVGTITIPTDQYVKFITQSTINNTVKFIWNKTSTEYPDGTYTLDLKPYVYTAGNGISTSQISDTDNRNKISVYLDSADENNKLFFNSTTGGLNVDLSGYYTSVEVDKLLPNMDDYYTKTETNSLIPDLSNYYTKEETESLIPTLSIDSELSTTSTNAVQNKVITNKVQELNNNLSTKVDKIISTKVNINLNKYTSTWSTNTWNGGFKFYGSFIWTDGYDIYYSNGIDKYVLDKSTSTWSTKTWNGLTSFIGSEVWTDGYNIYYSNASEQYVLDKATDTWSTKTWNGLTSLYGGAVWTDGDNIYYSYMAYQYVLDKATSNWSTKTWSGLSNFDGSFIWTDGDNIYYSKGIYQYVLDKATSNWSTKTWNGLSAVDGSRIWTDGYNIYHSFGTDQYVLDKATGTWNIKMWSGLSDFDGRYIWTDGYNIYHSFGTDQYILNQNTQTTKGFDSLSNLQNQINNNSTKISSIIDNTTLIANSDTGFAGGYNATATSGGSVGAFSYATTGGAVGNSAYTTTGGAVGRNAISSSGFAGGYNARTMTGTDETSVIDAIQLGTGTNATEKTLQVYDDNIYNANTHTMTLGDGTMTFGKWKIGKNLADKTDAFVIYDEEDGKIFEFNANGYAYVTGSRLARVSELATKMSIDSYKACTTVGAGSTGTGYIKFKISDTQYLMYQFGLGNAKNTINFAPPFSQILWASTTFNSTSDTSTARITITSMTNTSMKFNTTADAYFRWEAWGIV